MDCLASFSVANVQAILSADRVLLPMLCKPIALKGLSEAIQLIREALVDIPIDVLRTQYKLRLVLNRETDDLLVEVAEDIGFRLQHTTVPEKNCHRRIHHSAQKHQ